MDKNEYSLKLQEIRKLIDQENYSGAAEAADQVDWRKVRNINTLCLISEVYEAVGRYDDSKALLLRAYRRTPVGRSILYRLVEVCVAQKQFDEAIQYYSEFVQAAPGDTNRFILKYKIYKGRGSSLDEQIDVLKEYLSEEYNEEYAYELAKLYQQADRMEECIAACDDLVLWFHSGKYVIKALELKKRYAALTPKQQEIYDSRFDMEEEEEKPEDNIGNEKQIVSSEDATLADVIMADEEKRIAREVAEASAQEEQVPAEENAAKTTVIAAEPAVGETQVFSMQTEEEPAEEPEEAQDEEPAEETPAEEPAGEAPAEEIPAGEPAEEPAQTPAEEPTQVQTEEPAEEPVEVPAQAEEPGEETPGEEPAEEPPREPVPEKTPGQMKSEIAASMREVVGKVGRMEYTDPDAEAADELIEASKKDQEDARNLFRRPSLNIPDLEKKRAAGQLTLDDVLLSMGERGHEVKEAASRSQAAINRGAGPGGVLSAVDEALLNMGASPVQEEIKAEEKKTPEPDEERSNEPMTEVILTAEELAEAFPDEESGAAGETPETEAQPETGEPAPAESKEIPLPAMEDFGEGDYVKQAHLKRKPWDDGTSQPEQSMEEIINAKTRTLPVEEIARLYHSTPIKQEEYVGPQEPEEEEPVKEEIPAVPEEQAQAPGEQVKEPETAAQAPEEEEQQPKEPVQEPETQAQAPEETTAQTADETDLLAERIEAQLGDGEPKDDQTAEGSGQAQPVSAAQEEGASAQTAPAPAPEAKPAKKYLLSPEQQELFRGYLDIGNLDAQIYTAIRQAVAKGTDRTSRTGNVLIFGGHGSGKTTIGMNLAKAIAREKGKQYVKMARIYATDLNRKDIAATVAKIAGGILLVEEAGDLDDAVADQLTTAMEFRTDGLIIILEDEQKYLHDLLMRHPRLTMKFTSEIHIPAFTTREMVDFIKIYADDLDYVLSEEAEIVLAAKIDSRKDQGEEVSVANVIEITDKALQKANKASHKVFGGKKRFDKEGRIIVREKDLD